jgi:hypothetical protein
MFRPMLVKEEKLLLMAKTSEDESDILQAIKQVVTNCNLDPTLDIEKFPIYVLEYLFIKLRGFSIGDKIDVSYRDVEDQKLYDFTIDLNKIEIKYPEKMDNKIAITDSSGILMKYPTSALYSDKDFLKTDGEETFYRLIVRCIDQVYDGDAVYEGKDFSEADILEFLEILDIPTFDKIRNFMVNFPTLYYKLEYTNANGNARVIELKSLSDFFTLR